MFFEFVRVLEEMGPRRPGVAVLENVTGLATSHGGADLAAVAGAFNRLGYSVDALVIDARRFVPQSRPRLFVVGAAATPQEAPVPCALRPECLAPLFRDGALRTHRAALPAPPELMEGGLGALVGEQSDDGPPAWWGKERSEAFIGALSPEQLRRVLALRDAQQTVCRTAYRRTRRSGAVWEVRADDVAGCLRTAGGGSSRQAVVALGGGRLDVRWMSPRECARLMGAGDYKLAGAKATQALNAFGDAVAVPVVQWLARNYLIPLVAGA
jgi:DNA (cytosine-5)-methyltransferase 1